MRLHALIAAAISGAGILGLVLLLTGSNSVRDTVRDKYRAAGQERVRGGDRPTDVFTSTKPPTRVAKEIAKVNKPADRRVAQSGIFLRYSKDNVAVVPSGRGSRIYLDDAKTGYIRNYGYIGGWWGSYSGPGEAFRGGGPGSGK